MNNPYQAPASELESDTDVEYVGFWIRVVASFIDTILMLVLLSPIVLSLSGALGMNWEVIALGDDNSFVSVFLSYVFPALVVIIFWVYKSATPGKMVFGAKIVDANSGQKPSVGQLIGRYLAYYISAIPLCLGLFWVGWDKRKQGWHDKLARTVVVRER